MMKKKFYFNYLSNFIQLNERVRDKVEQIDKLYDKNEKQVK